jgi:indole-3-glycerol phosphate synthase
MNSSVVSKNVESPPLSTDFILTEVTVGVADSIGIKTLLLGYS